MLNRRGFLSLLGAGVAGLFLPERLSVDELVFDPVRAIAQHESFVSCDLAGLTRHIADRLSAMDLGLKAGRREQTFIGDENFAHQFCVDQRFPREEVVRVSDLDAIAEVLGANLRDADCHRLGAMMLPQSSDAAVNISDGRVFVRGVRMYDVLAAEVVTRFDVIGAPA